MRRRLSCSAAALGALTILALPAAASAQGPSNLQCNGAYTGTYANVVVPPNDSCTLTDSTVFGTATVAPGATLDLAPSTAARVGGNVLVGPNATLTQESGWTVGGTTAANGAAFLDISGGTTHDVLANRTQDVYVYGATVDGSVVANQTQSFGEVALNTIITGDVVANGAPASSQGFYIEEQEVGGSVYVTNNQSATNVFLNTIDHNLVCTANHPPPSDFGYGNYVKGREVGQCAGFVSDPNDGATDPLGGSAAAAAAQLRQP